MKELKIPKQYQDRVDSFKRYDPGFDFDERTYEVNLKIGWYAEGGGLHYCDSREEALEIMADAEYQPTADDLIECENEEV